MSPGQQDKRISLLSKSCTLTQEDNVLNYCHFFFLFLNKAVCGRQNLELVWLSFSKSQGSWHMEDHKEERGKNAWSSYC